MKTKTDPKSSECATLQQIVRWACEMESRQRQVPMDANDLRVQETVAELILLVGAECDAATRPAAAG